MDESILVPCRLQYNTREVREQMPPVEEMVHESAPPSPRRRTDDEPAGGSTTAEATPLKAWRKPTVRRILEGVLPVENGPGPSGSNHPETPTYVHIS